MAILGLIPACSGDDSSGDGDSNGGAGDAFLSQAPHCSAGQVALRIEGSIDGATVNDQRSTNISAALTHSGDSTFDSPFGNVAPPEPSELEIHLKWARNVLDGQTSPTSGGSLVAPAGAAHAGQTLCITQGSVGLGDAGNEDGVFKFEVSELRTGADCMGEVVPAQLRGCFEAGN